MFMTRPFVSDRGGVGLARHEDKRAGMVTADLAR